MLDQYAVQKIVMELEERLGGGGLMGKWERGGCPKSCVKFGKKKGRISLSLRNQLQQEHVNYIQRLK